MSGECGGGSFGKYSEVVEGSEGAGCGTVTSLELHNSTDVSLKAVFAHALTYIWPCGEFERIVQADEVRARSPYCTRQDRYSTPRLCNSGCEM